MLFNAPIGQGASFSGVVSVLEPAGQAPAGCPVDLAAGPLQAASTPSSSADEALMEKYLLEGDRQRRGADGRHPKALAAGTVIPIFCTSAKKDIGVAELLDALASYALSPVQGKHRTAIKGQGDKAPR